MNHIVCSLFLLCALLVSVAQAQVIPPNANPRFTRGLDVSVNEDSGMYSVLWATQISDGEGPGNVDSGTQSLTFIVVASQPSLFSNQPSIDRAGFLHFTPAPDAYGSSTVTVYLQDDGSAQCVVGGNIGTCPGDCSPTDCSKSATIQFQINIQPVNDCPRFQIRGDQTVDEDSGQTRSVGFAYEVTPGATNENTQLLTWVVTVDSGATLFQQAPQLQWSATNPTSADLLFTPADDVHGQAQISVSVRDNGGTNNGGCDQSATTQRFTITVNSVNDRPSFAVGNSPVTLPEDATSAEGTFANWATQISAGANENTQSLRFNLQFVDPTAASLFAVQPTLDSTTGTLSFLPAQDANTYGRTVSMYVQLQDNGGDTPNDFSCHPITVCPRVDIVITPVNDAPSFIKGGNIVVYEDLMNMQIPPVPPIFTDGTAWATGISVGAENEGVGVGREGQLPVFTLTNDNHGLFDAQPTIDARGTLFFQLKPNANGIATVTISLADTGNPPVAAPQQETFTITVLPVNDAPTFHIQHPNPIVINEDSGAHTIDVWAAHVIPGPLDEMTAGSPTFQQLVPGFILEPEDIQFFKTQPTVAIQNSVGTLQFEVAPNKWGRTRVRVILRDDGGIAHRGTDFSEAILEIIVNSVNDAPTFSIADPVITVVENNEPLGHVRTGFLYNISSGHGEDHPTSSVLQGQSVRFVITHNFDYLFSVTPKIDLNGRLTFTTANNEYGRATVTVYAEDNNMPPAVSISQTFDIDILPRNNPPSADIQGDIVGRQVTECKSATTCVKTFAGYATNMWVGPINERNVQSFTPTLITCSIAPQFNSLFSALPTVDTTTGNLDFTLAENKHTETGNPVTVTCSFKDNGGITNGGVDTTVRTFKLEVQAVEDPPTFTAGVDQVIFEDSPTVVVPTWAKNIRRGPDDSATEGLLFELKATDITLFKDLPKIDIDFQNQDPTGTLSYTPAPNKYGTAFVTVSLINRLNNKFSEQFTFSIRIDPVNDAPSFTAGPTEIVLMESSGFHEFQWATNMFPGPLEERQTMRFVVACPSTSQLYAVPPTMDSNGVMSLTLADAKYGLDSCTATIIDNGGSSGDNVDSSVQPFTIRVQAKNDAPSFVKGNDITMFEDNKEQIISNFVSQISAGAGDVNQQLTFVLTPTTPSSFSVPPRIDSATGQLTFTLTPFFNGIVKVRYYLKDNGPTTDTNVGVSVTEEFQIVVKSVNNAPSFEAGDNIAVLENGGVYRYPNWASEIKAGPTNEAAQTLKFTLSSQQIGGKELFGLPPVVDPITGDLMFSTGKDKSGVASFDICLIDNGGVENNGVDRVCKVMSVSIASVNKAPTAVFADTVTVLEDAGLIRMARFLTNVAAGGSNDEPNQHIVSIECALATTDIPKFKVQPSITIDTHELSFQTAQDFFGLVEVTVTVTDNGGTDNGGVNKLTGKFKIRVLDVNDRPTFVAGAPLTLKEDAAPYNALWATDIAPGPANEHLQTTQFIITPSRPEVFKVTPTINSAGFLDFALASNENGYVDLVIKLQDNGGTDNGGLDVSFDTTVRFTIEPINDAPTFIAGPAVTLNEDAEPFTHRGWATDIKAGPLDETLTQTLHFELSPVDASFFSVQPSIHVPTGDLTFTLAPNKFGTTTVSIKLIDNGKNGVDGAQRESSPRSLTVKVNAVNDHPMFVTTGDVTVLEDAGATVVKKWIASYTPGEGEASQNVYFYADVDKPDMFSSRPRVVGQDLLFTTAPDANGIVVLTLNATDRSGNANGGKEFYVETYRITVTPVNDAPVFTVGTDITVQEGSLETIVEKWLPAVSPGPADEASQTLQPIVTLDRSDILTAKPLVSPTSRSLSFLPLPYAYGTVLVSLSFKDNGGVANGGKDTSTVSTFRIVVTPVNNPPSFNAGPLVVMVANTGSSYASQWATNITGGPNEATQEVAFVVTNSMPSAFTVVGQPKISPAGALTFVLAPGVSGNVTLNVRAQDAHGATSVTYFVTIIIGNAYNRDTISLIIQQPHSSFNIDSFKSVVASTLGISPSRVVVRSVQADSTDRLRVDFQILAADNTDLTDAHQTRTFLNHALQPDGAVRHQLSIISASVVSSGVGAPGPTGFGATNTTSSGDGDNDTNWVALGVGLFVGIAAIMVIVMVVVAYRRHKNKKSKERALQYATNKPPTSSTPDMATPPRAVSIYESPRSVQAERYAPTAAAPMPRNPVNQTFIPKEPTPAQDNWAKVRRGITTPGKAPGSGGQRSPMTNPRPYPEEPDYQHNW